MIYVIEMNGKGQSNADFVKLLVFENHEKASTYIDVNTKNYSDGHKHWVKFDVVVPNEVIETFSE